MSREDVAVKVNYSPSMIGMIETCQRNPTPKLAGLLDGLFGTPKTFTRHEKRMRDIPFSAGFRPFQPYEAEATTLWPFEHTLVPGLFQTEDYARAILSAHPNTSAEEVEERVSARLARQEILTREDPPPPVVWVLLDENVLRRAMGGPQVMSAQLARLLREARRPNVTIQVIPRSVAHSGLHGAFVIAEVSDSPGEMLDTLITAGIAASRAEAISWVLAPGRPIQTETRNGLLDLARRRDPLVLRWAS